MPHRDLPCPWWPPSAPHLVVLVQGGPAGGAALPVLVLQAVVLDDVVVILVEPEQHKQEGAWNATPGRGSGHWSKAVRWSSVDGHPSSSQPTCTLGSPASQHPPPTRCVLEQNQGTHRSRPRMGKGSAFSRKARSMEAPSFIST